MLVLSRKQGESILIGDNIVITYLRSDGTGKIKIGIEAPKKVVVLRAELEDKKYREEK